MRFIQFWDSGPPEIEQMVEKFRPSVHEASNPFADWYFADEQVADEILGEWMGRPTSEIYVGRSIVMTDDEDEPVGLLIGMTGAELAQCRTADFAAFCEEIGEAPAADSVIEEVVSVSRELFPSVEDDTFYFSRLCINRGERGKGLARELMGHFIEVKQREGFTRFQLDVSADNAGAIHVYESLGMRTISRSRSSIAPLEYCAMALDTGERTTRPSS